MGSASAYRVSDSQFHNPTIRLTLFRVQVSWKATGNDQRNEAAQSNQRNLQTCRAPEPVAEQRRASDHRAADNIEPNGSAPIAQKEVLVLVPADLQRHQTGDGKQIQTLLRRCVRVQNLGDDDRRIDICVPEGASSMCGQRWVDE